MSESAAEPLRTKTSRPELPIASQNRWEKWSTRVLFSLVALTGAGLVLSPKYLGPLQGKTVGDATLLLGLAVLLLIIKMHLASQRKLLREVSSAMLVAASRGDRLEQYSYVDPQTELFNRSYLDHLFSQQAKRLNRSGRPVTVLLFELQLEGQESAAEQLTVEASYLLRANFRGSDYILRNSENQFLVLLPETSEEQTKPALRRLHEKIDDWNLENQSSEIALRHAQCTCTPGASFWEKLQGLEDELRHLPLPGNPLLASVAAAPAGQDLHGASPQ